MEKANQHEGTAEERGDGLGGEQVVPSDLEENAGKGARLDQAAPTPEAQMANQQGIDDAGISTGTNPTPDQGGESQATGDQPQANVDEPQKSPGEADSGSA